MWLMTTTGFYSATQHRTDPTLLVVRSRSRADLVVLQKWLTTTYGTAAAPENRGFKPFTGGSDYPWRVMVSKAQYAAFVAAFVTEHLDYGNFKDAVTRKQSRKRHDTYSRVWSALLDIEKEPSADVVHSWTPPAPTARQSSFLPRPFDADDQDADDVVDTIGACTRCKHTHYLDGTSNCIEECIDCLHEWDTANQKGRA